MSGNVISLNGGPTGLPQVCDGCVTVLSDLLERAKSGKLIGVCVAVVHHDGLASYHIGGMVGGYSAIGALEMVKAELVEINRGRE